MSETKKSGLIIKPEEFGFPSWADENIESSNVIVERSGDLFSVDALTKEGWLRLLGVQCEEEDRQRHIEARQKPEFQWRKPKTTSLVFLGSAFSATRPDEDHIEDCSWVEKSDKILGHLEDSAIPEQDFNKAVLFAETAEFSTSQTERLLNVLAQFISKERFSTNKETIRSLGSAIRKFAMNMNEDGFDEYACWLAPAETSYLDHIVELDLVQGVSWRLTYIPTSIGNAPTQLIETLQEIATQYMSPRFLVQKNYAATAVEAVVSLTLLRCLTDAIGEARNLIGIVRGMDRDWFEELVIDQLHEVVEYVSVHDQQLSNAITQLLAD